LPYLLPLLSLVKYSRSSNVATTWQRNADQEPLDSQGTSIAPCLAVTLWLLAVTPASMLCWQCVISAAKTEAAPGSFHSSCSNWVDKNVCCHHFSQTDCLLFPTAVADMAGVAAAAGI